MILECSHGQFISIEAAHVVEGQRTQRFRKAIIRVGQFRKDSENKNFEVTPATLNNWVDTFHAMKKNGVRVPIPNMHSGDGDPNQTHGWVDDMFVEGSDLVMTCSIIGEKSIESAAKADVSIKAETEFVDGNGNAYTYPIVHVAMVTNPVITGLGEFVPIAASHTQEKTMDWKAIQTGLGLEGLTDENASEKLLSHVQGWSEKVTALEVSLAEKPKEGLALSAKLDPTMLSLSKDNRTMKLDALVSGAKITPACRKELDALFVAPAALELSLGSKSGQEDFDKLVLALSKNDPVALGEKSKGQAMELANPVTADNSANALVDQAKQIAEAAKQ